MKRGTGSPASGFDTEALRAAVVSDRDLLRSFADEAESVDRAHDPKLIRLADELAKIASEAAAEAYGPDDEARQAQGAGLQLLRRHRRLDQRVSSQDRVVQ